MMHQLTSILCNEVDQNRSIVWSSDLQVLVLETRADYCFARMSKTLVNITKQTI